MFFSKWRRGALVLFVVSTLAACSSGVKLDDVSANHATDSTGMTGGATSDPRSVSSVNLASDPLNDPAGPLVKRSVYFDFDSYVVKSEYQGVIDAHARYLNANRSRKIFIQGFTDERGTTEYNLALGQKRADAVRRALGLLGVSDNQMEAVSFGKEKPKNAGHDESAWAENRRADIVY